jgi:dTDP-4-amino-4,6-dideoxygalactose transaminase
LEQGPSYACIIVTHLYGQIADMPAIMALADAHGVPVLEDCAQAHGAQWGGRRAGAWGAVASFSFYPTKNLGALGDGGAVVSHDAALAGRVRALRQYGWGSKYVIAHAGGRNSRLDEVQAAVLRDKLPHLDAANARRQAVARAYNHALADLPLVLPPSDGDTSVAHLYVLRVADRDGLARRLSGYGVQTAVHYPHPDHLQPAYTCAQGAGALPVTERLANTVLSLPCHPGLDDAAVDQVIAAVRACMVEPGRPLS